MARTGLLNIEIDNITMSEALDRIDELIRGDRNAYVVTPNVDHLLQVEHDVRMRKIYDEADLILTDGKPLMWFAKWFGAPVREKISGSDLFPALCGRAALKGYRMFFLGAAEGVAREAARRLTARFPGLTVAGTYSPPYGFEKDAEETDRIIDMIRGARPDILIVALGCPKQELFMHAYRDRLCVPVSLGLGASIDFEAGTLKRAPRWMSEHGLEWMYRMYREPRKISKRVFRDAFGIIPIIVKYGILRKAK